MVNYQFVFLFSGQLRAPVGRELVLDYIIERKRMDDLCGSIIDGRFREQKVSTSLTHPSAQVVDGQYLLQVFEILFYLLSNAVSSEEMWPPSAHLPGGGMRLLCCSPEYT